MLLWNICAFPFLLNLFVLNKTGKLKFFEKGLKNFSLGGKKEYTE